MINYLLRFKTRKTHTFTFTLTYLLLTYSRKNENLLRVENSNMPIILSFIDYVRWYVLSRGLCFWFLCFDFVYSPCSGSFMDFHFGKMLS